MCAASVSKFFQARFESEEGTVCENLSRSLVNISYGTAALAFGFGLLTTPSWIKGLAKGSPFNFKAVCIGASLGIPVGIFLGARDARKNIHFNASHEPIAARCELTWCTTAADIALGGVLIPAVLYFTAGAMLVAARRWGHPIVAAITSGLVATNVSSAVVGSGSLIALSLVWPYPRGHRRRK